MGLATRSNQATKQPKQPNRGGRTVRLRAPRTPYVGAGFHQERSCARFVAIVLDPLAADLAYIVAIHQLRRARRTERSMAKGQQRPKTTNKPKLTAKEKKKKKKEKTAAAK
jgi:hypothetical protein